MKSVGPTGVFMGKSLEKVLERKRSIVLKKWFDLTAQTYASDTAEFLKSKKDRFSNPVGGTMQSSLEALLDHLIHGTDPETVHAHLDPIVRIRAVQKFTPSQATVFVLFLKKICREELTKDLRDSKFAAEFVEFESKVDELCMMAFDIYMQCREQIFRISANETRNRTFRAFERAGLVVENPTEE
jgi:hypothetical protein